MERRRIALYSVTWAMKAQDALKKYGIKCEIVRIYSGVSPKGCGYSIEFDKNLTERIISILSVQKIPYTVLEGGR